MAAAVAVVDYPWGTRVQGQLTRAGVALEGGPIHVGQCTWVYYARAGGQRRAVKALDRQMAINLGKDFEEQLKFLRTMEHPHLLRTITVLESKPRDWIFIVMNVALAGTLEDKWRTPDGTTFMNEEDAIVSFGQVADALAFMHSQAWVHGNICPRAVFFMDVNSSQVALGSFSKISKVSHTSRHLRADDVYNLGLLILQSLTGDESADPGYIDQSDLSRDAIDLIKRMCAADPAQRLKMKEVTKHRWFSTTQNSVSPLAGWPANVQARADKIQEAAGPDWSHNESLPRQMAAAGFVMESRKLGTGAFATVYKGWKLPRERIAVKVIDLNNLEKKQQKLFWEGELPILKLPHAHRNICTVYGIFVENSRKTADQIEETGLDSRRAFVFMQLAKSDLKQLTNDQPAKKIAEIYARPLFEGAAKGLS